MNALLIDIGNTNIKYCLVKNSQLGELHTLSVKNWEHQILNNQWLDEPKLVDGLQQVVVASVGHKQQIEWLNNYAKKQWQLELIQLKTESRWLELNCIYQKPEDMGVDRWMAMIAVWFTHHRPCMVIDCGTAVTLDVINEKGEHLGGHILPGMTMMQKSLQGETAGSSLRKSVSTVARLGYGDSTSSAVTQGILTLLVDYLTARWHEFEKSFPQALLVITGGDGALIAEQLNFLPGQQKMLCENLVIKGIYLRICGASL